MPLNVTEPSVETQAPYRTALRDMIMLKLPLEVKASPGGNQTAIRVRTTNWKENRYERVCHVHNLATGSTHLLNRTGSVNQMEWVDDRTLDLLREGPGKDDKAQVWLYEGLIGEGWQVTDHKTGVDWFYPFAGSVTTCSEKNLRWSRGQGLCL